MRLPSAINILLSVPFNWIYHSAGETTHYFEIASPNNCVRVLQRMPQIEHNAPKFKYRIYYKLDEPGKTWNIEDIADWKQKELVIPNTDTYKRYKLKVVAHNQKGEANIAAQEVIVTII